jgi:putative addiction module component (TIGR02574 family)
MIDLSANEIEKLSPVERLELIGRLWDSLTPSDLVLTSAQIAELDRRLATADADLRDSVTWESLQAEFRQSR